MPGVFFLLAPCGMKRPLRWLVGFGLLHRYTKRAVPSKAHTRRIMEPMISRRRAYNDALSYLTPDQQERAIKLFNGPSYKPPVLSNP